MHSNFVTPPDYVETVLILNAPEEQIRVLAEMVQHRDCAYNVYFYHNEMNNQEWLDRIKQKADIVLDAKLTNPEDYFNK
jgi:MarR-like DNA-binding transcriptional regulator SgrR of sgrS sRNA